MTSIRNDRLIIKKFYGYLIAGIIIVFALQFGSLADGIVIGNILGEEALTVTSLCMPVIYLVEIPAFGLSVGAPIVVSTLLGKLEIQKAKKAASFAIVFGFLVSLLFVPVGIFASTPIATLLCGNFTNLVPHMSQYILAFCIQAPIIALGLIFSGVLGADNSPKLAAAFYIIANVVHIAALVLFCLFANDDFKFIGAGLSLGIGFVAGLVVAIPYFLSKTRTLSFTLKKLEIKSYFKNMMKSSSAAAFNILLLFVMTLVLNIASTRYLSTENNDLVIYAMLSNSVFIIDLVISGVLQLLPSVVGTLHGEKDYFSIKAVCKRTLLISTCISIVLAAITAIFPQLFFYIFGVKLDGIGMPDLLVIRIYAISFLFYAFNKFILSYYPSIDINSVTYVNLVTRNLVIGAPLVFVLIMVNGIMGFAYGTVIIEFVASLASIIFILILRKKKKEGVSFPLLLPKINEEVSLELSTTGDVNDISNTLDVLRDRLKEECHFDDIVIAYISLTIEEITTNMNKYSSKSNHHASLIDILVKRSGDKIILRIRDNNVNFDPTYKNEDDIYGLEGISILEKISSSVTYLRLLNLNNTIIEFETRSVTNGN